MSNTIKSLIVLVVIISLLVLIVILIKVFLRSKRYFLKLVIMNTSLLLIAISISLSPYVYPYNKTVDLEFVAALEVNEYTLQKEGKCSLRTRFWFCYYDIWLVESMYNLNTPYYVDLDVIDFDTDKYTYLFVPGYEVKSLKYNVWVSKQPPIFDLGTSPKDGFIELSEDGDQYKLYVYRFKRMCIDNEEIYC